ncbi:hypothetical protein BDP27DRAFT_1350056 [Rhodocollybia butyracea]|uniref:Uncharacterized protein n=1 Tax=Rhodocollybia butyracea TaxID=206335 RepID=A0A9P5TUY5_9AGAR|nr:hypothetical protein BDP27DRAFT_1350056 [Rhodocollybia butyracea]
MGCWDRDNDDGLTILDVTDPLKPSYAFVLSPEMESDFGDLPCTARDYLEVYHPNGSDEDMSRSEEDADEESNRFYSALTAKFDSVPFLTEDMLAEAWPSEFGAAKDTLYGDATRTSTPKHIPEPSILSSDPKVPALSELVVAPAVVHSLELGDTSHIELLVPGKITQIKAALCATSPFPETGLTLLLSIVQEELKYKDSILDLTGFSLSPKQLASVAAEFPNTRTVILSHSPQVSSEHIRALLSAKPEIDRLELLDNGIADDALALLLQDHPEIFKRPMNPGAFRIFYSSKHSYAKTMPTGGIAISVWTPAKIVQNIFDFLAALHPDSPASRDGDPIRGTLIQVALSSGLRTPDTNWKDRTVTTVPHYFSALTPGAWTFMFREAKQYADPRKSRYAFAKVSPDPGCTQVETYDLGEFLEEMRKEGRGPLPSDELVQGFNDLIEGVRVDNDLGGVEAVLQTMSYIQRALMNEGRRSRSRREFSFALFDNDKGSKFMAKLLKRSKLR